MTLRGPFMVSRKLAIRDEPNIRQKITGFYFGKTRGPTCSSLSVCPFKTSPCVPAPRAHISTHVRVVPVYTGTFWTDTRRRVEWTHGIFQRATSHHTTHRTHTTATRPQQHTETETCRDRERERQRKKTGKTRQQKREERRFIFSVVVHGRSLLMECFCLDKPGNQQCQVRFVSDFFQVPLGRSTVF